MGPGKRGDSSPAFSPDIQPGTTCTLLVLTASAHPTLTLSSHPRSSLSNRIRIAQAEQ
jgi:hypothetical protein